MSCTHINETHTSLAGRRYLLLDCLQYTRVAAETLLISLPLPAAPLHQTSGYFLMSVVQQMIVACHGQLQDLPLALFVAVQILAPISFMCTAVQFCVSIVTLATQNSHMPAL